MSEYWIKVCNLISASLLWSSNQRTFLTFTTLWANLTEVKLTMFFSYFFLENEVWHFVQTISNEATLYEVLKPVFWKQNKKNISIYRLLKDLHSMPSVRRQMWHWDSPTQPASSVFRFEPNDLAFPRVHVCKVKTRITLHISAVWSVSAGHSG